MKKRQDEIVLHSWYDNSYRDPTLETFIAFDGSTQREYKEALFTSETGGSSLDDFLKHVETLTKKSEDSKSILLLSFIKADGKYILLERKGEDENLIAINLAHIVSYDPTGKLRLRTLYACDSRNFIIGSPGLFNIIENYLKKNKKEDD